MGLWGVREEKVQNDSWVFGFRGFQGPWGVPGCGSHLVLLG